MTISNYEGDEVDYEDGDGDGDGDGAGVLMETSEGGWRRPPEVVPTAFPPSDLLRRQPSLSVSGFFFLCRLPLENVGGPFI